MQLMQMHHSEIPEFRILKQIGEIIINKWYSYWNAAFIQNKMKIFVRFTNLLDGVMWNANAAQKIEFLTLCDILSAWSGIVANVAIPFRQICSLIHSLGYYSSVGGSIITSCWEKISRVHHWHHYVKLGKKVRQWCISSESSWPSIPNETSENPLFHTLRNVGKWMLTDAFSPRSK